MFTFKFIKYAFIPSIDEDKEHGIPAKGCQLYLVLMELEQLRNGPPEAEPAKSNL